MGKVLLAIVSVLGCCSNSFAGFIISVGSNVPLLANTANQGVDVFLTSNSALDPAIKAMNLNVYIGNDAAHVLAADQGVFNNSLFNGVQLTGGGYFWDLGPGSFASAPSVGIASIAQPGVNFNAGTQSVGMKTTVKIATLKIDTIGLFSGTFAISLNDPFLVGSGATELLDASPASITDLSFSNGSYTIAAVPEPSTLFLVGLGAGTIALRRRRTRA